ncbi:MAG: ADP-ribosylation factor family protein [Candidatus Heimdallarchaeota archaeon]
MSIFRKLFGRKTKEANMTVCGLANAGKTSVINYLMYGHSKSTIPTMGVNINNIEFPNLQLNIFDLGGQTGFRNFWAQINEKSDAVVYIVDGSDERNLDESREVFHKVVETQINEGIPVLVLLNKADLSECIPRAEFIQRFGLINLSSNVNWTVYKTSAMSGKGLVEAFTYLVHLLEKEV